MEKALKIKGLQKIYGENEVLKSIDLDINSGDFFALLGVNGAGKTTIIGIITDLVNKNKGQVKVFGNDTETNLEEAKRCIGVVPQEFNLDFFSKVIDVLTLSAGFYGIPKEEAIERSIELLNKLGLGDKINSKVSDLSGGMKRRVMIARALVHRPKLLILDEPTAGVDINLRKQMWDYLKQLNKEGLTILLTTHYLEEVEELCNRIAVINKGDIIENLEKDELFNKIEERKLILTTKDKIDTIPNSLNGYKAVKVSENKMLVKISKKDALNKLFNVISETNLEIINIENQTNELEELFTKLSR